MIEFNPDLNYFLLQSDSFYYLLGISPVGDIHHLYWGKPLSPRSLINQLKNWNKFSIEDSHHGSREFQNREFPDFGHNDLRTPAYHLEQKDGSRISEFKYLDHEITTGKPDFGPGPSSLVEMNDEAQTLRIRLLDKLKNHLIELYYTLYPHRDILVRRSILHNKGTIPVYILKFMSAALDFIPNSYHLISFPGRWAKERQMKESELVSGITRLESRRGISSHEQNPFAMVTRGLAEEEKGEVYGISLAYSGNWLIEAEVLRNNGLRLTAGLNSFDFRWMLKSGESFTTPECVLSYSSAGFTPLSLNYHRFVRERVTRGFWHIKARPTLINNWEATYFNFNHNRILQIAKAGKKAGLELMVLDDGWFGNRNDDTRSLGDWIVNKKKLPLGLKGLSDAIHALNMKFGIWIEPEMISLRSKLYKKHPDWCLHVNGRDRRMARSQLVLDMSRPEIRSYLFEILEKIIEEGNIDYVKWDMNRSLSEVGNEILPHHRQGEIAHRYMMGVYELMDRFNRRFPEILFEGCAGGGGRYDLGLLSYHPQIWTVDNTDGLDRLSIQYSTSYCYPPVTMGSHISSIPNHITKRSVPLKWRALVAMSGNLGVEADIVHWTANERKELADYIQTYKQYRQLIQFGDFYRLESPYSGPRTSWIFVDESKSNALLFIFQEKPMGKQEKTTPIRIRGVSDRKTYGIPGTRLRITGKTLIQPGWIPTDFLKVSRPYQCGMYHLKSITQQ